MVIAKGLFSAVVSMKQTEALASVILFFVVFLVFVFEVGEGVGIKTVLNIKEGDLTMDIASVIIFFWVGLPFTI